MARVLPGRSISCRCGARWFRLQVQRHTADLVEESAAPASEFEAPDLLHE